MQSYVEISRMVAVGYGTEQAVLSAKLGYLTAAQAGVSNGDTITYRIVSPLGVEYGSGKYVVSDDVITLYRHANSRLNLRGAQEEIILYSLVTTYPNLSEVEDESGDVVVYIENNGNPRLSGNAKVWDDLRVPTTSLSKGGVSDPGFAQFKDDGSSSTGVFIYWFDATSEEELFFVAQLPHTWDNGIVYPHVHWVVPTNSDEDPADQTVKWGLEYTWSGISGVFGDTTIIYGTADDLPLVADTHYLTLLGSGITPPESAQTGLSSMLIGRVFRDASNDTYEGDAGLLEFDLHYQMDALGSDAPLEK